MRRRHIKSVLKRKLQIWLKSIDDENVRTLLADNAIVSGGSIASMLMGDKVNDYDIYFRTKEAALAAATYYVKKFKENPPSRFAKSKEVVNLSVRDVDGRVKIVVKSQGIAGEDGTDDYTYFETINDAGETAEEFVESIVGSAKDACEADKEKPPYRPVFLTSNAITLSHQVQIVIRFYGEASEIHKNYDFVHCKCSYSLYVTRLRIPQNAVESMLSKHLAYEGSLYPLCSFIRTRKFLSQGWTIDAGQYVKMAWDLNKLDLSDIKVLEDQMVGVDTAYFYEVLRLLREKGGDKVDSAYLMQVIDRVFG